MNRAQRLENNIHHIAENYADSLNDSAIAVMARELDAYCQFREDKGELPKKFRILFSDGSTLELDRLDSGALPSDPLKISMPLPD